MFFSFSLLIVSCEKDPVQIEELNTTDDRIINHVESMGYDRDKIRVKDDFVIHEDIIWSKSQLLSYINGEIIPDNSIDCQDELGCEEMVDITNTYVADSRQRSQTRYHIVSQSNVKYIKYYIHPSVLNDCGQAWINAIAQARTEWNGIANSRVFLQETNLQQIADIVIRSGTELPAIAWATVATYGNVGSSLVIHKDQDNFPHKKLVIMHELGHNLGFYHTDLYDGVLLHGTTNNDPLSVFNSGANNNLPNKFSSKDIRAIRLLYPNQLRKPSYFSATKISAGKVRIKYRNMEKSLKPFYWIRVLKYDSNGNLLGRKDFKSDSNSNGYDSVVWGGHTPNKTYKFAVRGLNYKKDVHSSRTSKKAVGL